MIRQRLITAAILVPVVLLSLIYLSGETLVILIGVVMAYGAWEWSRFVAPQSLPLRIVFTVIVADAIAALYLLRGSEPDFPCFFEAATVGWTLMVIWVARYPTPLPGVVASVVGAVILVVAWAALSMLVMADWQWLLFLLVLVWAADVGAYFAGKRFGVSKLAPEVSPGKTWAGVGGGVALALLVAAGGAAWFELPAVAFLVLCLFATLISVVGDLTVSMFKRGQGLKDSGRLLPGHGGLLDRVDSLLAASPVLVLGLSHLGVIQ